MPRLRTLAAAVGLAALSLGCAASQPLDTAATQGAPSGGEAVRAGGASARAVASGLLGSYLDQQAQELGAISDAEVTRRDDALIVNLASAVLFDASSAKLSADGADRVRQLARTVGAYPKQRFIVKGHTDSQGDARANQRLSEDRADSVRNLLVAEGVLPSRITAVGLGADLPAATNSTTEGRQQNHRVEIELRPDADVIHAPAPQ